MIICPAELENKLINAVKVQTTIDYKIPFTTVNNEPT